MASGKLEGCGLHGSGLRPEALVGRRLIEVHAAWHRPAQAARSAPVDVWLHDEQGGWAHITTGTDWCLILAATPPHEDLDLGEWGSTETGPAIQGSPFAGHIGEVIVQVREELTPGTGRTALELTFTSGQVRCESWAGDLRVL